MKVYGLAGESAGMLDGWLDRCLDSWLDAAWEQQAG